MANVYSGNPPSNLIKKIKKILYIATYTHIIAISILYFDHTLLFGIPHPYNYFLKYSKDNNII